MRARLLTLPTAERHAVNVGADDYYTTTELWTLAQGLQCRDLLLGSRQDIRPVAGDRASFDSDALGSKMYYVLFEPEDAKSSTHPAAL